MNPSEEQKTKTSVGLETPTETVTRAKAMLQPSISAKDLANPPATVNPPVPTVNTNDGSRTQNLVDNVTTNTQGFIQAQSAEQTKAKELADLLGTQTFDGASQRNKLSEQYGLPANLTRLTDIQTQLAKANTQSELNKVKIESGGQGALQGQRSLTQEDRENAVRNAGLAAEAAVLQGSIETANTLVTNAMTDYYSDRQANNKNMVDQLNYFSGIADEQTKQILEKEKRKYEEDQANITRVKDAVDAAVSSGAATAEDMRKLTDPKATDEDRLRIAQEVVGRGASEARSLSMEAQRANIEQSRASTANSYDAIAARAEQNKALLGTLNGKTQTETERLTEGYANRMAEADAIVSQLGEQFTKPQSIFGQLAPNILKTGERQKFEQAQRNFINSILRRESGAVISDEEFANARLQYFPQPGDSAGTLQQKEQNRKSSIANMYNTANVPMPELVNPTSTEPLQSGYKGVTTTGLTYTIE